MTARSAHTPRACASSGGASEAGPASMPASASPSRSPHPSHQVHVREPTVPPHTRSPCGLGTRDGRRAGRASRPGHIVTRRHNMAHTRLLISGACPRRHAPRPCPCRPTLRCLCWPPMWRAPCAPRCRRLCCRCSLAHSLALLLPASGPKHRPARLRPGPQPTPAPTAELSPSSMPRPHTRSRAHSFLPLPPPPISSRATPLVSGTKSTTTT